MLFNCIVEPACSQPLRIIGNDPGQGKLEICGGGNWTSICRQYWDCNDAKVACRQLGFTGIIGTYIIVM